MRRPWSAGIFAAVILAAAGCSSANSATRGASLQAVPTGTAPSPTAAGTRIVGDGSYGSIAEPVTNGPVGFVGPLTSLGHRTAGAVTLRLFTSPTNGQIDCDPYHSQCLPTWCQPTSQFAAELSTDAIAVQDAAAVIGVRPSSHFSLLSYSTAGTAEGGPVQVALLSVASDIDRVTLKTSSGADTASPVHGLVALAVPGVANDGTITAYDQSGTNTQTLTVPSNPTGSSAACALQPQKLPVPGTPPADPAAAERQIRAAFHTAFTANPTADKYSSLVAVHNGDRLHTAIDQVLRNFPTSGKDITVTTGRLVFINPTTAVVDWTPTYSGGAPYGPKVGTAVLDNGKWLVSEETYCGLLRFGGATCP